MNVSFDLLLIVYGVVLDNTIRKQQQCTCYVLPFQIE